MAKVARRFKPFNLGSDVKTGEPIALDPKWLETHLHLIGPPGSGKTRLLLSIYQQLARNPRATIVLVNPKGALARIACDWTIGYGLSKRLVWFDPGDPRFVMGYNPLRPNGLPVATQAKAARELIRSAWGQGSFDQTPQLARLLYLSLATALSSGGTLVDALRLLRSGPAGAKFRQVLMSALTTSGARGEDDLRAYLGDALAWFNSLGERRQEELSASTLARLESFVCDPVVSRIVTRTRCLDMGELIANHKILLVNLEIGRPLRIDDVKLLGRFVVNDLVNHVFSRGSSENDPVFLILDEVQQFATRDLCSILDMGRELGLHCVLAHQNLGQLRAEDETGHLYDSIMKCARTKFCFGGLHVEDLDILVRDACIEEFNALKIKDELTTLLLRPIESERNVVTVGMNLSVSSGSAEGISHARSRANSIGFSSSEGESSMDSESVGAAFSGTSESDILSHTDLNTQTHAYGMSSSSGIHSSQSEGEVEGTHEIESFGTMSGMSLSTSRVPFYEYEELWRVSSRTFESEQEFLTTKLQKIKGLRQAHAFVKVPEKRGRFVRLPRVRTPWISTKAREAGLKRIFSEPFYFRPDEDQTPQSDDEIREAAADANVNEVRLLPPAAPEVLDPDDENFAGPDASLIPRRARKKKE